MFFVHMMGRRSTNDEASTLEELGEIVDSAMASQANDAIVVSVGLDESAVMPYVWIRRNAETDEWEGELGDCIKLGIEDGSLIEHDPIQMLSMEQTIEAGIAEVEDFGPVKIVSIRKQEQPKKKRSNEELAKEADRMVKDLFTSIHSDKE